MSIGTGTSPGYGDFGDVTVSSAVSDRISSDGSVQLTELTVQVIGLYQDQSALTDRLWIDFGKFSGIAVLLSLAAPVLARLGWLPTETVYGRLLLWATAVVYIAFSIGNGHALRVAQDALERIAAQAQMASSIRLEVIRPASAVLFQRLLSIVTAGMVITGIWISIQTPVGGARVTAEPAAPTRPVMPAAPAPDLAAARLAMDPTTASASKPAVAALPPPAMGSAPVGR